MSGTTQYKDDQLLDELYDLSQSESLPSVDRLREIIESYGCKRNKNNNRRLREDDYGFFTEFCADELVTEGILRCLLEYFPDAINATDEKNGCMPLHMICYNKNATRGMVQLIIDASPECVSRANNDGWMPLYFLCANDKIEDTNAVDILGLLLERCPEAARRAQGTGSLPIHIACGYGLKSPEFCRMLIEAYPGSERMAAPGGLLPLHIACRLGTVAAAKYLLNFYPESINVAVGSGIYPIHYAILGLDERTNPAAAGMVQLLLDHDSNVALQKWNGTFPLVLVKNYATNNRNNASKVDAAMKILHLFYDAHPEVMEDNGIASNIDIRGLLVPREVHSFINTQLNYARQARNSTARQMKKRDENGQVPLHRSLRDNATLGSIKLLVKRNPSVILTPDNSGALPLHVAIQHHDSPKVVDYLIGLDSNSLSAVDRGGNTALHLACRGAKYDTIALLLEKYGAVSVSQSNVLNKLPIHLLFESDAVSNSEDDTKYLESVFQLLRANPETVMVSEDAKQAFTPQVGRPSHSGKKRKYHAKRRSDHT